MLWAVALMIVVVGELLPGDSEPIRVLSVFSIDDAVVHFTAYAVVAMFPALGLPFAPLMACLIATELVGVVLEFAQMFIAGRSYDPWDVMANTVGVLAGTAAALALRPHFVRRGRPGEPVVSGRM
jgi:VanZ family protein